MNIADFISVQAYNQETVISITNGENLELTNYLFFISSVSTNKQQKATELLPDKAVFTIKSSELGRNFVGSSLPNFHFLESLRESNKGDKIHIGILNHFNQSHIDIPLSRLFPKVRNYISILFQH